MEHDQVKHVIGKGQCPPIGFLKGERGLICPQSTGFGHKHGGGIVADRRRHARTRGQHAGHRPGATADLQYARVLGDDGIRQICVEHRPLLRVGGAEFQAGHEPFQERWSGLRNRGIDIGHSDHLLSCSSSLLLVY
jgi:hypothetical protein